MQKEPPCQVLPKERQDLDKVQHAERLLDEGPEEELGEQRGRQWGLPQGCSEPRPQQVEIRIADEVLAMTKAALENELVDKATENVGKAQN